MKRFDRVCGILAEAMLALLFALLVTLWSLHSPAMQAKAAPLGSMAAPLEYMAAPLDALKPVDGWYVCKNLGFGAVPGVSNLRQRLKLCHDAGWEFYTYCTQPGLPVPPVGRKCIRISEDVYECGAGNQHLREYRTLQTPVDTATPTATLIILTSTPTLTASLAPVQPASLATPTSGYRVPTSGEGNAMQLRVLIITEICVLLLAAIVGAWIIWRVAKNR